MGRLASTLAWCGPSRALLGLAALLALASCIHDFDAFDPAADAGAVADSSSPPPGKDAGGSDSSSPPKDAAIPLPDTGSMADVGGGNPDSGPNCGQDCLINATACDGNCASEEQSCAASCDGGSACLSACLSTRASCAMQCVTVCETCTSTAGCINPSGCMGAAP